MRRLPVTLALVLLFAACGDDDATTSTIASPPSVTTSITTVPATTGVPATPSFILRGETGPYVEALQFLLNCSGHGPLEVDGAFGSATAAAVEQAQDDQGAEITGEPTEATFAALSRACDEPRNLPALGGDHTARAAGNATRDDPDRFTILAEQAQTMRVVIDARDAVDVTVGGEGGTVLRRPDGSIDFAVNIPLTQVYELRVTAAEATSYLITVALDTRPPETTTTTEGPGRPAPEVTLNALFAAVTQGDLTAAMALLADGIDYHTGTTDYTGADGRERLRQAFVALSDETMGLVFTGIDGSDGSVLSFTVTTLTEDPRFFVFAARFDGATIVEWWDQPSDVEGGLRALFHRVARGDIDGAMTLFQYDGITYHRADGATFEGVEGRARLQERFEQGPEMTFQKLTGYGDGLATFDVTDPEPRTLAARYETTIAEWWEDYTP